jgi:hypothetical protein
MPLELADPVNASMLSPARTAARATSAASRRIDSMKPHTRAPGRLILSSRRRPASRRRIFAARRSSRTAATDVEGKDAVNAAVPAAGALEVLRANAGWSLWSIRWSLFSVRPPPRLSKQVNEQAPCPALSAVLGLRNAERSMPAASSDSFGSTRQVRFYPASAKPRTGGGVAVEGCLLQVLQVFQLVHQASYERLVDEYLARVGHFFNG